jgi:adenylyltransferase/sulfurtransferase
LYPEPPPPGVVPSCAEGGVLGVLPGFIGTIQATETLKLIVGAGTSLVGRVLLFDALAMRLREVKLRKDPDCPVCGSHPSIHALIDYEQFCGMAHEPVMPDERDISPAELNAWQRSGDASPLLLDVREPQEYAINRLPGSILIPMGDLPRRIGELDPTRSIVVYCRVGERSARAAELLRGVGFRDVRNLTGGIRRWIDEVDPSQPKY